MAGRELIGTGLRQDNGTRTYRDIAWRVPTNPSTIPRPLGHYFKRVFVNQGHKKTRFR